MYLLHAPIKKFGLMPPNTSAITEDVRFTNNYAFTNKQLWKKIHCAAGCLDVSPAGFKKLRKKIEYKSAVFVVKGGLGDCLWTLPVIKKFKEKNPNCFIYIVTDEETKLIWKNCQFINTFGIDMFWNTNLVIRRSEVAFDLSGIATVYKEYMQLEPVEATFKMMGYKIPKDKKEMRPDLTVTIDEGTNATKFLEEKGVSLKRDTIITIGLDASTSNRHYPFKYIQEVSKALIEDNNKVVWLGKSEEYKEELLKKEDKINGVINLCATTNLREVIGIISLSDLHINPNSGLLVLSTALNIPTIGLFGAFKPEIRSKYYERFKAMYIKTPCSPCNEHWTECRKGHPAPCMKTIYPSKLYKACKEMLHNHKRSLIEKAPIE